MYTHWLCVCHAKANKQAMRQILAAVADYLALLSDIETCIVSTDLGTTFDLLLSLTDKRDYLCRAVKWLRTASCVCVTKLPIRSFCSFCRFSLATSLGRTVASAQARLVRFGISDEIFTASNFISCC